MHNFGKIMNLLIIVSIGIFLALLSNNSQKVLAVGSAVTMAGLGQTVVPGGTNGDTWDSAWRSDGSVLLQNNDGNGWGGTSGQHDQLSSLSGTPENPSSISGSNISSFLGSTYSSSVYEVDSALYHITLYSNQSPCCTFRHASILKSTDGGSTWINHLGQTNTLTADTASASTFPSDNWGEVNFVKYGQGGAAPNIDNAQTYVYFTATDMSNSNKYYMARVLRSDLSAWTTTFDKTKIKYLAGNGDGSVDSNWVNNIASAVSVDSHYNFQGGIVYDYGLDRYILATYYGNSFANPPIDSTVMIREAPHPWGPWTEVLSENVNNKENDNLSWIDLTQKFTSTDGQKMWATASGRNPYGLQFLPIYLTTQPVQSYEAENAVLSGGTSTASSKAGYTGSGYVTGFTSAGAKVQFTVNVATSGAYILKIRYDTNAYQTLGFYVNGVQQGDLKLGNSENSYSTWTEYSMFTWLQSGNNTVAYQLDTSNTGNLNLDNLSLALYSTVPGSLPGANPPSGTTTVDDSSSGITYSGTWGSGCIGVGYYNNNCHYSNTAGSYVQYTFTGTSITWIGGQNNDHGKVDIYIDGAFDSTIDTYASAWNKQVSLYTKSGLASGSHTIKIVLRSDHNASSSGYYTDVDAFQFQ